MTCTRAALATGTTAPAITVMVTAPAQAASLTEHAPRSPPLLPTLTLANNSSSAPTTVTASANLSIVKTGPATVVAGGSVSYSLVVANAGPSDAASVSVADTLPAGVTFVSATGGGLGVHERREHVGDVHPASLAAGATAPTITVLVTAPAQAGTLTNSATVSSPTPDPNPATTPRRRSPRSRRQRTCRSSRPVRRR